MNIYFKNNLENVNNEHTAHILIVNEINDKIESERPLKCVLLTYYFVKDFQKFPNLIADKYLICYNAPAEGGRMFSQYSQHSCRSVPEE